MLSSNTLKGMNMQSRLKYKSDSLVHVVTSHTEGFLSGLQLYLTHSYLICTDMVELT